MNESLQIRTFKRAGHIEVICGSMFSGKTEELIRRIRRAQIAKQRVKVFKPRIDDRYSEFEIVSHSEQTFPSEVVIDASEIYEKSFEAEVIGIDEGQFFENSKRDNIPTEEASRHIAEERIHAISSAKRIRIYRDINLFKMRNQ